MKIDNRQRELIEEYEWYGPHLAYRGYDVDFKPHRADLHDADLSYANLRDANLSRADLHDADLSYANLSDANLSGANLSRADLSRTDMDFASLPLWYGSLEFKDDSGEIIKQIAYHLASLMLYNDMQVPGELLEFANGWGGIERHDIKELGEGNE